jgi:hypothetical protein
MTPSIFDGSGPGLMLGDDDALGHGLPLSFGNTDEDDEGDFQSGSPVDGNVVFSKVDEESDDGLSARISRIFYINAYGTEIQPRPNPAFLSSLSTSSVYVPFCYSTLMGKAD